MKSVKCRLQKNRRANSRANQEKGRTAVRRQRKEHFLTETLQKGREFAAMWGSCRDFRNNDFENGNHTASQRADVLQRAKTEPYISGPVPGTVLFQNAWTNSSTQAFKTMAS